jgi:cytoskeletal protein RodZ
MNLRLVDPLGERVGPAPTDYAAIGEFLRAVREHQSLTLAELAGTTRIRRAYLQGIEEGDRSALPARPFAIGYVRSYAQALGLDGDAAAARFKKETPDIAEPFHDPVGVAHEKPKRSPLIIASIALVVSGVVLWNVVQRTMVQEDRATASMPAEPVAPASAPGNTVVAIGASTPAPAAQNLPEPYVTPGLNGPAPEMKQGLPVAQAINTGGSSPTVADAPTTFTPKAAVYGAPASPRNMVVLQARKPASLIVRGPSGAVYFARQLAAGEAYRAPVGEAMTAEVTDPAAFVLYVANDSKGPLVSQQTALDKLAVAPAPPVRPAGAALIPGAVPAQSGALQAAPVHANIVRRPVVRRPPPPANGYDYTPQEAAPPAGDVAYYPPQQRN